MSLFHMNVKQHPAEVAFGDRSKVSKERLVGRVARIKQSLAFDKKHGSKMSQEKIQKLKNEVKGILLELGAREETLDKIVDQLTD